MDARKQIEYLSTRTLHLLIFAVQGVKVRLHKYSFSLIVVSQSTAPMSGRFYDLMEDKKIDLTKLTKFLDAGTFWRKLADKLGFDAQTLERMQTVVQHDTHYSPSRELLMEWQHYEEATTDNLLEALHHIKNFSAYQLVKNAM